MGSSAVILLRRGLGGRSAGGRALGERGISLGFRPTSTLLAAPATPTLTLLTAATDNTPSFTVAGALVENDAVRLQYGTSADFSTASDTTDTIDAAEDAANQTTITTPSLADDTWRFRARIERTGHNTSEWSNTVTQAIDATSPVLSSPGVNTITQSTALAVVTTDEANGTLYMVVTTSATDPSKAQIKAGQNHAGAAASFAANQAVSSTGQKSFSVTGLSPSTTYYAYFMHEDAVGHQSNIANFDAWATSDPSAAGAGVLSYVNGGGGRTPVFLFELPGDALAGDVPKLYVAPVPDGSSFVLYITGSALSSGDVSAGEVALTGATLLDDSAWQAYARIDRTGVGLGDLSNEASFDISTALTLTFLDGPEIDYNEDLPFLIEGDFEEDDQVIVQADKDSAFGSVDDTGSKLYQGGLFVDDSPVNSLGPLGNGLTYFRAYRVRVGKDDTYPSNLQSTTIDTGFVPTYHIYGF